MIDLQELYKKTEFRKAISICLFFFFFFSITPLTWHTIADFDFHFEKAQGCNSQRCNVYYPLLHFFGQFFILNEKTFLFFLNLLLLFVTPLILFFITKNSITVWLYFSVTQYVYLMNGGGAYAQVLAVIFWLGLFATKNNFIRLILLILGTLAHSQGQILLLFTWLVLAIKEGFFKNAFLSCSSLFGANSPEILSKKIDQPFFVFFDIRLISVPVKDFLNFFARGFPFPFFLIALWQTWKEKDWVPIILTIFLVYGSLISSASISAGRILVLIPLVFLPALTRFYESFRYKKLFLLGTLISFAWVFGTWFVYKLNCV